MKTETKKQIVRGLAVVAAAGFIGGQALGANGPIPVGDAPVHAVPSDEAGPVEPNSPPNTLNAQYASLAEAPAQSRAPEGPAVQIAPAIIDAAGAFEAYMRKAGTIDPKFGDGGAIAKAVSTGSSYEIGQFQQGMVAYAALAALQEPAFVQAVYDLGRDRRERDALAERLFADPKAALEIDGAEAAAATLSGMLAQMGVELVRAGQGVRQAAYDVQRQPWSKEAAPDPQRELAETKARSAARTSLGADDTSALIKTVVALRKAGGAVGGRAPAPTPTVQRALAVAALAVLGRAGEADAAKVEALMSDGKGADCMKMAKLNLYQCLAVAGPHYEHAYCLGQHALMDTGQCVISSAGQSPIRDGVQKASAPAGRGVSVPIALTSTAGPERASAYARPAPAAAAEPEVEPRPESAEAARQQASEDRAEDRDEGYEPPPPRQRRAARDDRYDDYYRDQDDYRDRQDYDPYAPPRYGYRFGR
jgi:hypothetical protein